MLGDPAIGAESAKGRIRWRHRPLTPRSRLGSARLPLRSVLTLGATCLLGAGLAIAGLCVGEYPISPMDALRVLAGWDVSFNHVVVVEWRLPRVASALMLGAALGMSGAIFQGITRNPLGSPDIMGFGAGAYTGALVVVATAGRDYYATAGGAAIGGFLTAIVVYLLGRKRGTVQAYRLIVVGIAVAATMNSVNQWFIIKVDLQTATTAALWAQGSLNGIEWEQTVPLAAVLALLVAVLATWGTSLAVLQMGDDVAGALGLRPERSRVGYLLIGVLLIAVATAAAGPISFVALAAPQIGRRLTGSPGVGLTAAAVTGAVLLLASDLLAQTLLAPTTLPVGAVTVCLGGAYLAALIIGQARKSPGRRIG